MSRDDWCLPSGYVVEFALWMALGGLEAFPRRNFPGSTLWRVSRARGSMWFDYNA